MTTSEEVVGTIVMMVDGQEYDCVSFESEVTTGSAQVPTMNRKRRTKHHAKGNRSYSISTTVTIPLGKDIVDWENTSDARITIESPEGGYRKTYLNCTVTQVSESYGVDATETRRNLSLYAMDCITETL